MVTLMLALCLAYKTLARHVLRVTNRSGLPPAHSLLIACAFIGLFSTVASATANSETAHDSSAVSDSIVIENNGSPVEIDGKPVLLIYAPIAGFTPGDRASAIQQRIIALSRDTNIAIAAIHAEDRGTWTEILAGNNRIMGITEGDAKAAERPRVELAEEYTEVLRLVVKQYREDHTWRRYWRGIFYAALASVCLVVLLVFLFFVRRSAGSRIERWLARREAEGTPVPVALRLRRYLGPPFTALFRTLFWIVGLALLQSYLAVVLRFFPSTRYASYRITNLLFSEFAAFGKSCLGYIPNLLLILCICLVTSYLIKVNKYVFQEISNQRVTIRGFYPDWAEPTAKLTRTLILAAAAIVVFPYLPGSESPAFKGISVFLGVLLSLGSTSAVAHAVAGTILTYMRAFQVGDFVRIGNDVGEVIEKTLLVTRICTQKKEVVTIPNSTVLGGVVVNYSAEARQKGVIFHTTVTIGYNAPWRQVHELLISAALATEDVLRDPAPFVVQTALNDFYVGYELNASTVNPKNMQTIYSRLHQNIQDKFNEAGVEINSPHYTSLRDGNRTTIPDAYLPANYCNPVFEVQEVNGTQMSPTVVKHS
jgi:small-conductance mechanosensitive channel